MLIIHIRNSFGFDWPCSSSSRTLSITVWLGWGAERSQTHSHDFNARNEWILCTQLKSLALQINAVSNTVVSIYAEWEDDGMKSLKIIYIFQCVRVVQFWIPCSFSVSWKWAKEISFKHSFSHFKLHRTKNIVGGTNFGQNLEVKHFN